MVSRVSRRDELLESAARLFMTKGYHATGVDEIGEAVGVTGPAMYRHFSNKQAILDAVCLHHIDLLLEGIGKAVTDADAPPEVLLRRLVDTRVDFALTKVASMSLHSYEERYMSSDGVRALRAKVERYFMEWMHVLVRVRPDTPTSELHTAIVAAQMLIGYTPTRITPADREVDAFREQLAQMALAVLLA
jgi:AcrR family transcriptional regulator